MIIKDIYLEIIFFMKTSNFAWFVAFLLFHIIYYPIIIAALIMQDIFLSPSIFWNILKNLYYIIIIYDLWAIKVAYYDWEGNMEQAFYKTCVVIIFGIFIWFLISMQSAY